MVSSLAFKWQGLKFRMSVFQLFYEMKLKTSLFLKFWHFKASRDIITKFKSKALYVIRIKYQKASVSGNPPSLILLHKQATRTKHFDDQCIACGHGADSFSSCSCRNKLNFTYLRMWSVKESNNVRSLLIGNEHSIPLVRFQPQCFENKIFQKIHPIIGFFGRCLTVVSYSNHHCLFVCII